MEERMKKEINKWKNEWIKINEWMREGIKVNEGMKIGKMDG